MENSQQDALTDDESQPGEAMRAGTGTVALLDQGAWRQLREADTIEAYAAAWLALQIRLSSGASTGAVVLGGAESGGFHTVAVHPPAQPLTSRLLAAAEKAMEERRGVAQAGRQGESAPQTGGAERSETVMAFPLLLDGTVCGVVGLTFEKLDNAAIRERMREMQWGAQVMEYALFRFGVARALTTRDGLQKALEQLSSVVEEPQFDAAALALVTELSEDMGCERVSLGFRVRGLSRVQALSHSAKFGKRMNLLRLIAGAMDEAIDQVSIVVWPEPADAEGQLDAAHRVLADTSGAGNLLTVPFSSSERILGALLLERSADRAFTPAEIELVEFVAGAAGPALDEKRRNDQWLIVKIGWSLLTQTERLFGPRFYGRKLALLLVLSLTAFFWMATGIYRVTAEAALEGTVQRTVTAAFDGYLEGEYARAGDVVGGGAIMARLDSRDLGLERSRRIAEREELALEHSRALGVGERAQSAILTQKIVQVEAQIGLLDEQIARAEIRAPYAGVVVSGDLSQQVGGAVRRGDELFVVAPLDSYRVILGVPETQVADIVPGQRGVLVLTALPSEPLEIVIDRLTPVAEARDGATSFRVEATLTGSNLRLRPGMEGIGKIDVEERPLIWIWTRGLLNWARLAIWRYWP